MNTLNNSISYNTNKISSSINGNKDSSNAAEVKKSLVKINDANIDNSDISEDAKIGYEFLARIRASAKNDIVSISITKYTSEYEKIKKEIESGAYGSDKSKYKDLLDNAFKNVIDGKIKVLLDKSNKISNKKISSTTLVESHKQYETATTLVWMFRADHKRILKEIEEYKRKKNHRMVAQLTQLSNEYKHIIINATNTAVMIQNDINDYFNDTSNKSTNPGEMHTSNESVDSDQSSQC